VAAAAGRGPRRGARADPDPVRGRHVRAGRGVRRRVLRRGRRPHQGVVPAARRCIANRGTGHRGIGYRGTGHRGADRGQVHRLRRRAGAPGRARPAARARLRAAGDGHPGPGRTVEHRRHRRPRGRVARGPGEFQRDDQGHRPARGLLLHPPAHRRGAGGRDGLRADRRRAGGGDRDEPGRRARAGGRRAGPGTGRGVPRRRPVPVRHPARHHAGPARPLHRGTRVPGPPAGPGPGGAGHAAVRGLRAAGPPDHRAVPAVGGADGRDLPAVHGVRRVQRDRRGQGDLDPPVHRPRRADGTRGAPAQAPAGVRRRAQCSRSAGVGPAAARPLSRR